MIERQMTSLFSSAKNTQISFRMAHCMHMKRQSKIEKRLSMRSTHIRSDQMQIRSRHADEYFVTKSHCAAKLLQYEYYSLPVQCVPVSRCPVSPCTPWSTNKAGCIAPSAISGPARAAGALCSTVVAIASRS